MQAKENMQTQSASKSWENALNTIQTNLKPEDIEIIKNLSKMLRNFRCRWTNQSNRNNTGIFRATDKTSTRRKNKK